MADPPKPRVFVDADVPLAASAAPSERGASTLVLRMAEITLIEAISSEQVIAEAEGNLERKVPRALPAFGMLVSRCLRIVAAPLAADVLANSGLADGKDLPLLLVALREGCSWLISLNLRHYAPGHPSVAVLRPGDVVLRVRDLLAQMSWN